MKKKLEEIFGCEAAAKAGMETEEMEMKVAMVELVLEMVEMD